MKKYNPIYYLLFILLVMGTFASMAQNSYGLKIMGGVAFIFGLVFLIQFISRLRKKEEKDLFYLAEPAGLFILAVIFGMRVFYIYFSYVEYLFLAAAALLGVIYLVRMITRFRHLVSENKFLAMLVIIFHGSIILFLASLALVPFSPAVSEFSGKAAFGLLLLFVVAGLFKGNFLVNGENISAFRMVRLFRDHSIIIITLFTLFSLYVGLNRVGMLPGIYSDEFPRAYFELVDRAASKKEKPVDGRYRHEDFMESYSQFLQHHKARP